MTFRKLPVQDQKQDIDLKIRKTDIKTWSLELSLVTLRDCSTGIDEMAEDRNSSSATDFSRLNSDLSDMHTLEQRIFQRLHAQPPRQTKGQRHEGSYRF